MIRTLAMFVSFISVFWPLKHRPQTRASNTPTPAGRTVLRLARALLRPPARRPALRFVVLHRRKEFKSKGLFGPLQAEAVNEAQIVERAEAATRDPAVPGGAAKGAATANSGLTTSAPAAPTTASPLPSPAATALPAKNAMRSPIWTTSSLATTPGPWVASSASIRS